MSLASEKIKAARARTYLLLAKIAKRRNRDAFADANLRKAWQSAPDSDVDTALRYGNMALRNGDTLDAIEAFTQASKIEPENPQAFYKLGFSLERSKDWKSADLAYQRGQKFEPSAGSIAFRRGRCLTKLGQGNEAISQYGIAIRDEYRTSDAYLAVYALERTSPLWKRLETLRAGTEYHLGNAKWLCDRAVISTKMGYYAEAIEYFLSSDKLSELSRNHRVDLARCFQELGQTSRAAEILTSMAKTDDGPAKTLGAGVYFRDRGYWREAIALFKRTMNESATGARRAKLEFEIGHAYDRQYNWAEARIWFEKSLVSDGRQAYPHYRLGVVLERLGYFDQAMGPYARALQLNPSKTHWYYRLGVCARRAGKVDVAHRAFRASIGGPLDLQDEPSSVESAPGLSVSPELPGGLLHELGINHVSQLDSARRFKYPAQPDTWQEALERARSNRDHSAELRALRELSRRKIHLSNSDTIEYTNLLLAREHDTEALDMLEATRDVRFPDGLDLKKYLSTRTARQRTLFAEYQQSLQVSDDLVFLESNHGSSIGCHPLALFREMSRDGRFSGATYIWAFSAGATIPEEIASRSDVILVEMRSDLYLKYLAVSKYLINNVSFPPYFVRRTEQIYLNTWHGTPLKTLGRSMHQGLLEYENLARNFVQATHVCSPNELTDWALFEDHRISRYAKAARRVTGSPRLDRLIRSGDELRTRIRKQLGVSDEEYLILYAPTWRGGVSEHEFDTDQLTDDLKAMGEIAGGRLFFRAHRLTEKLVSGVSLPADVVPHEIDTNDLLAAVDILVTDYSSIAFDFLPTGRPVVFYTPDIASYSEARGLYLSPQEFPGMVCNDRAELLALLGRPDQLKANDFDSAIARYSPLEDGQASSRTIDFMLEPVAEETFERPLIVVHASMIPNGIASAFLALLYALDPEKVDIVLVVEAHVLRQEEGRRYILGRVPDYVDLAFRIGGITATAEEQWAIRRDDSHDVESCERLKKIQSTAWTREARRVLGAATPHTAIEFDGYATLWADFVSNVGTEDTRHLIWQHNQLVDEWRTKYPELAALFRRYPDFDLVVPVAESLAKENRMALTNEGFDTSTEYSAVQNVLDVERILESANKPLDQDLQEWLNTSFVHVVSIGRLSPEKNLRALVEAWPRILKLVPRARLTIVGSGLLEGDLKARAGQLGVTDSLLFAGQRANPYPVLKRANLFVLPSVHEGQPVVILEAMTLGTPVAAAYTPGTAELLELGYGVLIGHDSHTMSTDIVEILKHPEVANGTFDGLAYRQRSIQAFMDIAVAG